MKVMDLFLEEIYKKIMQNYGLLILREDFIDIMFMKILNLNVHKV